MAAEIAEHNRRYYQDDDPAVSDAEYDALRADLEAMGFFETWAMK